jgi:hypothetical protein
MTEQAETAAKVPFVRVPQRLVPWGSRLAAERVIDHEDNDREDRDQAGEGNVGSERALN